MPGEFGGWRSNLRLTRASNISCMIVLLTALLAAAASAEDMPAVSRYHTNMYIAYNRVLVESAIIFSEKTTAGFSVVLPYDATSINTEIDDRPSSPDLDSNRLIFSLDESEKVEFYYITEDLLEKDTFIASMSLPFDAEKLTIKLELPENVMLDKPVRKGSVSGSSVYPKPARLETDGQVIHVVWSFEDLEKGDEIALYVKYRTPARLWLPVLIIVLGILLVGSVVSYMILKRGKAEKAAPVKEGSPTGEASMDWHVKDDEQQVINILRLKGGGCDQGTLRVATGFSKAKLSGLLKEMEARKMVHKERRGKKNLVFLKG